MALQAFQQAGEGDPKPLDLNVPPARRLKIGKMAGQAAIFSFKEICEDNLGPRDYMALAHHFHTVVVLGLPKLTRDSLDIMRRFIWMVD
jgi:cell division protein ZapE